MATVSLSQAAELRVRHLYELSNFTGPIPYSDVMLTIDREFDEIFGAVGNTVRVFNAAGMETYQFEYDSDGGRILDLVVGDSGDIFLLTFKINPGKPGSWAVVRCDYRGEPFGPLEIEEFPAEFASFQPNLMTLHNGRIYLVSKPSLQAVVLEPSGEFVRGYDFSRLLHIDDPGNHEMFGFDVSPSGEMLFTIPVLFKAYVVSPDETVLQFGSPGSAPGKFGIASGITADDNGHYLIADKLRWVVMVFDAETLQLVTEIGGKDDTFVLTRPTQLAMGGSNKLYITQSQSKGVAVYSLAPGGVRNGSGSDPKTAPRKGGSSGSTVSLQERTVSGTKPKTDLAATVPQTIR